MSPAELAAIRARVEAATPGPWGVWEDHAEVWSGIKDNSPESIRGHGPIADFSLPDEGYDEEMATECVDNAVFAAAARTDVPALLDEVERLRRALLDIMPTAKRGAAATEQWGAYNAAKEVLSDGPSVALAAPHTHEVAKDGP